MKSGLAKIVAFITLVSLILIFQSSVIASRQPDVKKLKLKPYFNRIIVQFKKGVSKSQKDRIIAKAGKSTKAGKLSDLSDLSIVSPKVSVSKALKILRSYSQVQYASADYRRKIPKPPVVTTKTVNKLFYTPQDPAADPNPDIGSQ